MANDDIKKLKTVALNTAEAKKAQAQAAARQVYMTPAEAFKTPGATPQQWTRANGNVGSYYSPKKSRGLSWSDYNRYENDYNTWHTTGQHTADFNSWASDAGLSQWRAIRDRKYNGGQAALIGDTYYTMDKDTYSRYEKDYNYWLKHKKHTKDFESWADDADLETWRTIRDYNAGVKSGQNPSMELQSWINGLDPDVLNAVRQKYQSEWVYDVTDPEDMMRQQQGLMPKAKDSFYTNSEMDRWLYANGLPSNKSSYLSKQYAAAQAQVEKNRAAWGEQVGYDFSSTPEAREYAGILSEYWKSQWKYTNSAEDQRRKAAGLMPAAVEKSYTDSEIDQYYKMLGLPPAAELERYDDDLVATANSYKEFSEEFYKRKNAERWKSADQIIEEMIREDSDGKYRLAIAQMEQPVTQQEMETLEGDDLLSAYLSGGETEKRTKSPFTWSAEQLDQEYNDAFAKAWQEDFGAEYQKGDSLYDYVIGGTGSDVADLKFDFTSGAEELEYDELAKRVFMIDSLREGIAPSSFSQWKKEHEDDPTYDRMTEKEKKRAWEQYQSQWHKDHPDRDVSKLKSDLDEQSRQLHKLLKDAARVEHKELYDEEQDRRQPVYDTLAEIMGIDDAVAERMFAGKELKLKEIRSITGEGSLYRTVYDQMHAELESLKKDPGRDQASKDREAAIEARVAELAAGKTDADPRTLTFEEWLKKNGISEDDVSLTTHRDYQDYKAKNDKAIKEFRAQAEKEIPKEKTDYEYARIGADAWSTIMDPTEYDTHGGESPNETEYMTLLPYITPEQLKEFVRIAKEDGAAAAGKYWTKIRPEAEKLKREKDETAAVVYGQAYPLGASLTSLALTIPAGVMGIRQEIAALTGDYRQNDWRGSVGRMKNTLTQTVQNEIANKYKGGPVWSFLYGGGMSIADSLQTMSLGNAGLFLMASSVAGSTVDKYIDMGADLETAAALGIVLGGAEFITEKLQMDRLLSLGKKGALHGFLRDVFLREGGSEALEEITTEIAGIIADRVAMGDESEFRKAVIERMQEKGMTEGEAVWDVILKDSLPDIALAGLGGYLSGIVMGVPAAGINASAAAVKDGGKWYQFSKGQQIVTAYQNALERGSALDPESEGGRSTIRQMYSDLNNSGMSDEGKLGAMMVLQTAARTPSMFMSESGQQAVSELKAAISQASEQNRIFKAEAAEARTRAQTRLSNLMSGIQSAYQNAGEALATGNLTAQTKFLNQMYDAIDQYNGAYAETQAVLETQAAKQAAQTSESGRKIQKLIQRANVALREGGDETAMQLLSQGDVLVDQDGNPLPVNAETLAAIRSGKISVGALISNASVREAQLQQAYEKAAQDVGGYDRAVQALIDMGKVQDRDAYQELMDQLNDEYQKAHDEGDEEGMIRLAKAMNDLERARQEAENAGNETRKGGEEKAAESEEESESGTGEKTETEETEESGEDEDTDSVEKIDRNADEKAKKYSKGVNTEGIDLKKQSKSIRRQARVLDALGKRTGTTFVLHETLENYDGKEVNGKIDAAGVMHINMSEIGNGLLYYATHELTHGIRRISEEQYRQMRDLIRDHLGWNDATWNGMIEENLKLYGWEDTAENRDKAEEELICDRMPAAFGNRQFVADLINRDAGFVRRILDRLNGIYKDITDSIYEGAEHEDEATETDIRYLMDARQTVREMADALQNGLDMMARKNGHTEAARYVEGGTDGEVRFNLETMERDLRGFIHDIAQAEIPGFGEAEIRDLEKGVKKIMRIVRQHTDLFDYKSRTGKDRPWTPLKENSDKHYKMALDFSTLCKKRILTQAIVERLQTDLKRALSPNEQAAIRLRLQDMQKQLTHIQIACGLCYVEAARLKSPKVINQFIADIPKSVSEYYAKNNPQAKDEIARRHAALLESYAKDGKVPKSKKDLPQKGKDEWNRINHEVWDKYTAPENVMERARAMKPEQFLTAKSLADMAVTDPDIYQAFKLKVTSAARSKTLETDMPFERGDSFAASDRLIEEMNRESGFRHQSWSDFQFLHVLDTMAAIIEMSTRGAKMHAYTKVAEMAHVVGKTGMMLNLSMIPAGESGLDGNGNLVWDPVEGMDWNVMMQLRETYPDTVGNIAIGITDAQIKALMASDDIDYIIPYHASGLNKAMRKLMGLHGWLSYQATQNEKKFKDTGMEPPALADWFDEDAAAEATDGRAFMVEASKRYLEECYKRGYIPKFPELLTKNGDRYSLPEDGSADGYWKTLVDRKMVNQQTNRVIIQQAVKPIFDTNRIAKLMQEDVDNPVHRENTIAEDTVVEEIMRGEMPISDEETRKVAYREAAPLLAQYRMAQRGVNTGDLTQAVTEERYSLKKPAERTKEKAKITIGMNDSERESILRMKGTFGAPEYKGQAEDHIRNLAEEKKKGRINLIEKVIVQAKKELGVPEKLFNEDTELIVFISNGTVKESLHKQVNNDEQLVRLFPVLKEAVQNAVGIDVHDNRYFYDDSTLYFANLLGGYVDRNEFIPVRFGIKASRNGRNALYVVINGQGINKAEVLTPSVPVTPGRDDARSAFTISLPLLIAHVNHPDILKYLPDGMLSNKQREIKWEAIAESARNTNNKNDEHYLDFVKKRDMRSIDRMIKAAAEKGMRDSVVRGKDGKLTPVYHGTDADFREFDHSKIGKTGTQYGQGFYFTDSKEKAGAFQERGGEPLGGYLDIRRPGSYERVTFTRQELTKLITELAKNEDFDVLGGFSRSRQRYGTEAWTRESIRDTVDALIDSNSDREVVDTLTGMADDSILPMIRKITGVDGFIAKDSGGNNIYVIFDSSQFKKLDPLTYREDGSLVNISERFDLSKRDINYSLKKESGKQSGDLLDAVVPTFEVDPEAKQNARTTGDLTEAVTEEERKARAKALDEARSRALEERWQKKKRDRERRRERAQRKAEQAKLAAEQRMLEEGTFAPQAGREDMPARTRRNRLTEEAYGKTKELGDLVAALNEQLQTSKRKVPNPKRVMRAVKNLLANGELQLNGVTMDTQEIADRLGRIMEEYRNNPDREGALESLLTGCNLLARDILESKQLSYEEVSGDDEGEYDALMDLLERTTLKVGPKGQQRLIDAFGSLKAFRKAIGGSSILDIRYVDSDAESNFEDLDGMIGQYLEGDVEAQLRRAFGDTNTLDIAEIAEFVQERREEQGRGTPYRDYVGDEQFDEDALELGYQIANLAYDSEKTIPNTATYGDRGARAIGDVARDMAAIASLVNEQQERIAEIGRAGNEEAAAANDALFRANKAYRDAYRAGKTERQALAERNRILNEENERLAKTYEATARKRQSEAEGNRALYGYAQKLNRENDRLARRLEATGNALASGKAQANAQLRRENQALRNMIDRKEERFERFRETAKEREQARVEETKAQAEERKNVEKLRRYVTKNATALNTWLQNPTKQKHVPAPLQEAVAGILENIDIAIGKNGGNAKARDFAKSVAGLREFYAEYLSGAQKKYGEFFSDLTSSVPAGILDALDTIGEAVAQDKKSIGEMNSDELAKLNMILGQTRALVMDTNETLRNERFKTVDELGRQTQKDAAERKQRGIWKGGLKAAQDLLSTKLMDAFSFAKMLGSGAESIVDELSKGFEKSYLLISDGQSYLEGMLKKNGVTARDTERWSRETVDVRLANTGTVKMTVGQAMNLYNLGKRAQALPHLLEGGLKIEDVGQGRQVEIFNVTAEDLRAIGEQLTPKQKAVADALQSYLATECADWGNEAWMTMYHYEMFGEKGYWPIKSAKESVKTRDAVETSQAINAYVNMGSTKALVEHAKNPLLIGDAFDVFTAHVSQMARLNGLGPALEDALKWYNWVQKDSETNEKDWTQTTKGAIDKLIGADGSRYFLKLVQDINGLSGGESGTGLASQLMSKYKRAAVAGKLRVVVQQPSAVLRAMAMIPAKYFANDYAGNIKKNIREMQEKNGLAWWKSQGNYDIGTGKSMRSILFGTSDGAIDRITNAAMTPAGWADDFAWGWLWSAVKKETADTHPDLKPGTDEYWKAVNERFSDVVNQTQVVDGVLQRSDIMRSKNGLDQMATAFMAEPIKSWNMIGNRVRALMRGGGRKEIKELFRALVAFAMSVAVNSAVLALHDTAKNRQRGDKFSTAFSENFIRNGKDDLLPWNYVPYIKDIAAIMQGDSVERMDMSMIQDVYKAAQNGYKYFTGTGTKTGYKVAADLLSVTGAAFGVPTTGLIATMETVVNGIHPGAIKKTAYLDKEDRATLRAAGLSYDEGYGIVSQYKRHPFSEGSASSNADKGIRLLQAADAVGGRYDDDDYGALAAVLGIKYDPEKDGSLGDWTRKQAGEYLATKGKDLKKGKITPEKYEEIETKYGGYADLLTQLGY